MQKQHTNTVRSLSKHNTAKTHFLISIFVSLTIENHLNILKTRSVYWGSKTTKDVKTWQTWWLEKWDWRTTLYAEEPVQLNVASLERFILGSGDFLCCYCCPISCNKLHPAATSAVTLKVICSSQQTVAWLLLHIRANDSETHKPTHLQEYIRITFIRHYQST